MIKHRISAVITAFNSEQFIVDAINSVLNQSLTVDEIVVVDDGSNDRTADLVSKFSDQGVRYVYQNNQGPSSARNRGIQETTGEFITFLDSDDLWLVNKNQSQVDFLSRYSDIYLVSGLAWWWDTQSDRRWLDTYTSRKPGQLRRDILVENFIGNPSMVMVRRAAFESVGFFNPILRWGEDWDLWIRIISRFDAAIIPEPVIVYRSHQANISHSKTREYYARAWEISRSAIRVSKPVWPRPFVLARAWSNAALERAMYAIEKGYSRREQLSYALSAFFVYPFDRGWKKLNVIFQSILGDKIYQIGKTKIKSWIKEK